MASIDNRIVSMEMRNQQFEQNAKNSIKTIEALDASLSTLSNVKGLDNVNTSGISSSLDNISDSVNSIANRFKLLGSIAFKVLTDITTLAYNTGKNLVSAFTIEPIFTGFQEYETQINAIQTILSNTRKDGTNLEQVNSALDELNHYADMTIYNFTEMTRNIGTFTAAGVDLDTSVMAIKGIANLAAISGSNSEQASRAMYQLSQAIASGVINLQDWNSVVNAGMGGQVFQDALKETARIMGKNIDESKSFRESISTRDGTGWLDAEVLLETLKKFTGDLTEAELLAKGYSEQQAKDIIALGEDANNAATKVKTLTQLMDTLKEAAQSGFTQSWKYVIGDFEEARESLTKVSDTFSAIIGASAEARNAVLADWKALGGRDELFAGLKNIFEVISSYATIIKNAFTDIFPPATGAQLLTITQKFKNFTSGLKLNVSQMNDLKDTFKGIFSLLNIFKKTISSAFKIISPIFGEFSSFGDGILSVTSAIGRYITKLDETIFSSENFNEVVKVGKTLVTEFIKLIKGGISKLEPLKTFFTDIFNNIKKSGAGKTISDFFQQLTSGEKIKLNPESITKAFDTIKAKVKEFTSNIDFSGISAKFSEKFEEMGFTMENFKDKASDVITFFKELKDKINETLGAFTSKLGGTKKSVEETKNIFSAKDIKSVINTGFLGILVFSIKNLFGNLSKTFEGSHKILDNIADVISKLGGVLEAYSNDLNANALLKIAGAIAILAAALAGLAFVPFQQLSQVTVLLMLVGAALLAFFKAFSKIKASLGDKKKDSGFDFKGLIGDIVEPFTGVIKAFQTKIKMEAISTIAMALLKFVTAIGVLALIPADRLKDTVIAMGVIAAELSVAVAIMSLTAKKTKGTTFAGLALTLVGLGIAISSISKALKNIGELNKDDAARSITTLSGLLGILGLFMVAIDNVKTGLGNVATIVTVTGALIVLSGVMALLGKLELDTILKGLAGMAGLLGTLAIAINLMNGTISGAASMIVVAGALAILTPELAILGNMEPSTIAIGILALAAAFGVIGAAAYLIQPVAPSLMAFSASLAGIILPIGVVILAISKLISSFEDFANGLVTISNMSNDQIQSLITNLTTMINGFLTLLPQMQTMVASIMSAIITAIVQALVLAANDIAIGLVVLLTSVLELLARYSPLIFDSVLAIIAGVLSAIRDHIGEITVLCIEILNEFLIALGQQTGPFIESCLIFLTDVINGIADAIVKSAGPLADAIVSLVDACTYVLIEAVKAAIHGLFGPAEMVADAILGGLRQGLDSHSPSKETEAIGNDAMSGLGIGIDEDKSPEQAAMAKIEEMLSGMRTETASFGEVGRENAEEYTKQFSDFSFESYVSKGTTDLLASLTSQKDSFGIAGQDLGNTFGDNLATSVDLKVPEIAKSGNTLLSSLTTSGLDTLESAEKDYDAAGEKIIGRLTDGMTRSEDKVLRVIGDIMGTSVEEINDYYDKFFDAGENLVKGLAWGIKTNGHDAISAAAGVAAQALKAAEKELDINSPSKAFEYVGQMSDEGFAYGLTNFSGVVTDAAKNIGSDSVKAVQTSLQEISNMAFEDIADDPVITPVLDLSNIQSGANQIDNLISTSRSLSFNAVPTNGILENLRSISGLMAPKVTNDTVVKSQNTDPKMLEILNKLETRITQLGDAVTHMQVVMDTGALVGQISGPIDRSLGWKTTLRNRGV